MTLDFPRSWAGVREHRRIQSVEDFRGQPGYDEDASILVTLADGWLLNDELEVFWVSNLLDLRGLWPDIRPTSTPSPSLL